MKRPYTLGLYEKSMPSQLGWKEKLEAAKGAGFDFVEISIDETEEKLGRLDMSEEERLRLVSLMKEVGLPPNPSRREPSDAHRAASRPAASRSRGPKPSIFTRYTRTYIADYFIANSVRPFSDQLHWQLMPTKNNNLCS